MTSQKVMMGRCRRDKPDKSLQKFVQHFNDVYVFACARRACMYVCMYVCMYAWVCVCVMHV